MPADFPPWDRAYAFFRRRRDHALVQEFHDRLRSKIREKKGRDTEPTAGVIDSQSAKADAVVGSDSRGFDGGKLINGRKRHVVVDTLGLLLGVMVTAADTGDRAAAQVLLEQVADAHHRLALVWADSGYTGPLVEYCLATLTLVLAIVKRSDDMRGFVAQLGVLRRPVRHQPRRGILRQDPTTAAQPWRRPPGQRGPLPDRPQPPALGRPHPGLPAATPRRGQDPPGDHQVPEAIRRTRNLPTHRPHQDSRMPCSTQRNRKLTSIGASTPSDGSARQEGAGSQDQSAD
jgi:transposase